VYRVQKIPSFTLNKQKTPVLVRDGRSITRGATLMKATCRHKKRAVIARFVRQASLTLADTTSKK